jgi:ABC-type uncharacterized transport system involved in gliding motility auxiliary subunit
MNTSIRFLAAALILAGLVLVNFIASYIPWRADFTESKIYTLSPGTEKLLSRLSEPVSLQFYFSRSLEGIPIFWKNYATRVEDLLREYVADSGGRVSLEIIDPKPDSKEEQAAIAAGLVGEPLPNDDKVYFGIVARQADREKNIGFILPQRESFLEFDISQLVFQVQQTKLPRLGLYSSLPVFGSAAFMPNQRPQEDWWFVSELRRSFQVEQVSDELPANLDVLAIVHPPADVPDKLRFAIDQFVMSGKPVLVALDPSSFFQKNSQGPMRMGGPTSSNLPGLLDAWGVVFTPDQMIGDLDLATDIRFNRGDLPVRNPTILTVRDFNKESPATSQLNELFFIEAGSISLKEGSKLDLVPLVSASPSAGTLPASMAGNNGLELSKQLQPNKPGAVLAAIVRGKMTSAFPNGEPPPPAEEGKPPPPPSGDTLKESKENSTLVVIADTDFLVDQFTVQFINLMGMRAVQPLNDNIPFVINVFDMLAGSQDLISLRGKGSIRRPFTRVKDLEQAAEKRYQIQLDQLETQLREVQNQLNQLVSQQKDTKQLMASPEVQKSIEKVRLKEAELRNERREIRKKLREDIEELNLGLSLFNILAAPLIVTAIGIVVLVKRSRRRRS